MCAREVCWHCWVVRGRWRAPAQHAAAAELWICGRGQPLRQALRQSERCFFLWNFFFFFGKFLFFQLLFFFRTFSWGDSFFFFFFPPPPAGTDPVGVVSHHSPDAALLFAELLHLILPLHRTVTLVYSTLQQYFSTLAVRPCAGSAGPQGPPVPVQESHRAVLLYGFIHCMDSVQLLYYFLLWWRAPVQAALDPKDPLYQSKRAIVQRNDKLTIQTFQVRAVAHQW